MQYIRLICIHVYVFSIVMLVTTSLSPFSDSDKLQTRGVMPGDGRPRAARARSPSPGRHCRWERMERRGGRRDSRAASWWGPTRMGTEVVARNVGWEEKGRRLGGGGREGGNDREVSETILGLGISFICAP